jgi:hypothetical protein
MIDRSGLQVAPKILVDVQVELLHLVLEALFLATESVNGTVEASTEDTGLLIETDSLPSRTGPTSSTSLTSSEIGSGKYALT